MRRISTIAQGTPARYASSDQEAVTLAKDIPETFEVSDIQKLYVRHSGEWLLLEVTERNEFDQPIRLRLIAASPDKETLRELVLEDDLWDWSRRYLMVFADPDKPCTI